MPETTLPRFGLFNTKARIFHSSCADQDFCTQRFQSPPHRTRHAQYTHFFQEELFPLIETQYRVLQQEHALFGFSGAGFFALHMLFTQPGMFRRYVAAKGKGHSPGVIGHAFLKDLKAVFRESETTACKPH
jgi:hypothetical protein